MSPNPTGGEIIIFIIIIIIIAYVGFQFWQRGY